MIRRTMPKTLTQATMLLAIGLFALYTVSRSTRFAQLHGADVVLLLAAGLCFGIAISMVVHWGKD